jgi:hypothetical protein
MKRFVISSQYWVYIDDGQPKWVEKYHQCRDEFREWYGKRGGVFQTKFPPIVPDYSWTNQSGDLSLLKTIKKALDPNNVLSPKTFDFTAGVKNERV